MRVRRVAQGDDRGSLPIAGSPVRRIFHASRPAEAALEADDGVGRRTAVTLRGAGEYQLRPVRPGAAEGHVALHVESSGEGERSGGEEDDLTRGTRRDRGLDLRGGAAGVEGRANRRAVRDAAGDTCVAPVDRPRGVQDPGPRLRGRGGANGQISANGKGHAYDKCDPE